MGIRGDGGSVGALRLLLLALCVNMVAPELTAVEEPPAGGKRRGAALWKRQGKRGGRGGRQGKWGGGGRRLRFPDYSPSMFPPGCGNGKCESHETNVTCLADCPGVTTPAICGEEPHSDTGGHAVVWGASHKKATASECCDACAKHAADPKNAKRPCVSWVFCQTYPQCWSLDTGNWHGFGECWLKWQSDPKNPLYGQRGKFTEEFRKMHWRAHFTGRNPDGTPRNLSVPTHVPWTGGVLGARVDHSIKWETGPNGMHSSAGESTVLWRAWESREQNLARGVRAESMGK